MAQRHKIIAWSVGLGLIIGGRSLPLGGAQGALVSVDADHEPLLAVIRRICAAQGLGFVANDAALERAGKISLSLHEVPLETALEVICEAYALEARVKNKILVVRPKGLEGAAPAAPQETPRRNTFLPEEPRRETPTVRPLEPKQVPASVDTAAVSTVTHSVVTTNGGITIVGTVVEVGKESVKVKEQSGEPREFLIAHDDQARASRLESGLRRVKVGDRIALEYRVLEGHAFMTNLVAGGNPQPK